MLTISDVVVDPVLSNVSTKYSNEMYLADKILPVVPTAKQTGKYYVYNKAMFRRNDTTRALGAKANEVEYGLTTASFEAFDHALKEKLPFEVINQADSALSPETDSVESVTEQLLVDKEIALATTMADTAVLTSNTTLSGTSQWSDYNNSDPIGDVRTGAQTIQQNIFRKPNTLILGKQVFDKLMDHPAITERLKYTNGIITEELLARLFNVDRVWVAEAGYNSATEGATDSLAYIWGKHAWLVYIAPTPRLKQVTFGWQFTYQNRQVMKWDDTDAQSRFVRVNENYVQKLVAVQAAYLIKNAVA